MDGKTVIVEGTKKNKKTRGIYVDVVVQVKSRFVKNSSPVIKYAGLFSCGRREQGNLLSEKNVCRGSQ